MSEVPLYVAAVLVVVNGALSLIPPPQEDVRVRSRGDPGPRVL
jgi:hypothetical protein